MFLLASILLWLLPLPSTSSGWGTYSLITDGNLFQCNIPETLGYPFTKGHLKIAEQSDAIWRCSVASQIAHASKDCPDLSDNKSCDNCGRVSQPACYRIRGGANIFPAGWNPFGYKITNLGLDFLKYEGSLESDIGRFLKSLTNSRKTKETLKASWLEVVRVAKTGQSMRIYRQLDELIQLCLSAGFID